MYTLNPSKRFKRKAKKMMKKDPVFKEKLGIVFDILEQDPFYKALKTHKVVDIDGDTSYSSRITADIRIIWDFNDGVTSIIDLIDIGGHSGNNKVYK